jgi:hypothetical protein
VNKLDSNNASLVLIILGILGGILGLILGGWFWSGLTFVGISWVICGVAYFFADREITDGGFLAALILGIIGVILWLVVDTSRNQKVSSASMSLQYDKGSYERSLVSPEDYKCKNCSWFNSSWCKRQEKLINAEPCKDFRKA